VKIKKRIAYISVCLLSVVLLSSCTSFKLKPVLNYKNQALPGNMSMKQAKRCIITGATVKGWSTKVIKTGLIQAWITVRSHYVSVYIPYSRYSYSILYHSSHNMLYKNGMIHRNYNRWVVNLNRNIQKQIMQLQMHKFR